MTSLILFSLAVVAYTICDLWQFGKLRWTRKKRTYSFWGTFSDTRKYKYDLTSKRNYAPDTWYYRFFKIKYRERFPLSATLLVCLTDGFHLSQLAYKILLCCSIALYTPLFGYWDIGLYFLTFGFVFTVTYKVLS